MYKTGEPGCVQWTDDFTSTYKSIQVLCGILRRKQQRMDQNVFLKFVSDQKYGGWYYFFNFIYDVYNRLRKKELENRYLFMK